MATMKLIYEGDIITQCIYHSENHFEQIKQKWAKRYPKHLFDKCLITGDLKPDNLVGKGIALPDTENGKDGQKKRLTVKSNTPTQRYKVHITQKVPF
jgi:hypothetical protein